MGTPVDWDELPPVPPPRFQAEAFVDDIDEAVRLGRPIAHDCLIAQHHYKLNATLEAAAAKRGCTLRYEVVEKRARPARNRVRVIIVPPVKKSTKREKKATT